MADRIPIDARAFAETADPGAYVPRPATERVLAALGDWAGLARDATDARPADGIAVDGPALAALVAPPGIGKTLLLRVFEERLRTALPVGTGAVLSLPYAGLDPPDLVAWVHGLLGRTPPAARGPDSDSSLDPLVGIGRVLGGTLVLLIDDADSMPLSTARALVRALPRTNSPLRVLLALNEGSRAGRLLAVLAEGAPLEIPFREHLSASETAAYLRARMAWAALPASLGARLEHEVGGRIHALSGGLPRRVNRLAAEWLERGGRAAPGESGREGAQDWMGRPIEET